MGIIFNQYNEPVQTDDIAAVSALVALKQKSGSNPWPVIEKCLDIWAKKRPKEWKSHLIHIKDTRETRKERKFASSTDKVTGGILRYTLDIPQDVILMIRCIYSDKELPMDREFFKEWAWKFPQSRIAEKI